MSFFFLSSPLFSLSLFPPRTKKNSLSLIPSHRVVPLERHVHVLVSLVNADPVRSQEAHPSAGLPRVLLRAHARPGRAGLEAAAEDVDRLGVRGRGQAAVVLGLDVGLLCCCCCCCLDEFRREREEEEEVGFFFFFFLPRKTIFFSRLASSSSEDEEKEERKKERKKSPPPLPTNSYLPERDLSLPSARWYA